MPKKQIRKQKKGMMYKDERGNVLYGFSQENLEKTNKELRRTNNFMVVLIVLVLFMLGILVASVIWADVNNVITAMIYR